MSCLIIAWSVWKQFYTVVMPRVAARFWSFLSAPESPRIATLPNMSKPGEHGENHWHILTPTTTKITKVLWKSITSDSKVAHVQECTGWHQLAPQQVDCFAAHPRKWWTIHSRNVTGDWGLGMCHITYVYIAGPQPWQLRLLANVELNFHCEAVQPRQLFLERWLPNEHYLYRHFALKSSSRPKFDAFRFPYIPYILR